MSKFNEIFNFYKDDSEILSKYIVSIFLLEKIINTIVLNRKIRPDIKEELLRIYESIETDSLEALDKSYNKEGISPLETNPFLYFSKIKSNFSTVMDFLFFFEETKKGNSYWRGICRNCKIPIKLRGSHSDILRTLF